MKFLVPFLTLIVATVAAPQFGDGYSAQQPAGSASKYLPPAHSPAAPIVHKQYFLISAPDEIENSDQTKQLIIGRPQKNYRVIFIKSSSSDNSNVKLSAEYAPQEEKTAIYVLSKNDNEIRVDDIATPSPSVLSKPEIHFIKYNTPEEAAAAQKQIQEQYEQLGGTSEVSDEGIAPISSVVGSLDGASPDDGYDYKQMENSSGGSPTTEYLPPASQV